MRQHFPKNVMRQAMNRHAVQQAAFTATPGTARGTRPPSATARTFSPAQKIFASVLWTALTLMMGTSANHVAAAEDSAALTFEKDIAGIFTKYCARCHGVEQLEGGIDLRLRSSATRGGDSGAGLVPGMPEQSIIWQKISSKEMPPADQPQPTADEVDLIRRWIAEGAGGSADEPAVDPPPSRISDEDREFWSFKVPRRPAVPSPQAAHRVRTPIDAFLLQRLEEVGLTLNEEAPREILARRLYYDLLGLPPTPEQLRRFLEDPRPDAYEHLVDELLNSPQYGERQARHWLDVAGYADSDGYLAADRLRPEGWRYRDWVIQALERDLPYDQFILQQIAGDELVDWRRAPELTPEMTDSLIATGFLRTASDPTYPSYTEPNEIHQVISDTMQIVGTGILGLTIHCARCHNHKFDPISQRDYYSLFGVFAPAMDPNQWLPSEVRGIGMATEAESARILEQNKQVDDRVSQLKKSREELASRFRDKMLANLYRHLGENVEDTFDGSAIDSSWTLLFAGTAKSWREELTGGTLHVREINGDNGYAMARLVRPVVLNGEFTAEAEIAWQSSDSDPASNTAMQGVQLILRDAAGQIAATAGFIDENNTARGSPILAIGVGPDAIEHYLKLHQQAVPPGPLTKGLEASGQARIRIERDPAGNIQITFDDGKHQARLAGECKSLVVTAEIEFRRYVLGKNATFEGLSTSSVKVSTGAGSVVSPELKAKLQAAILTHPDQRSEEQKQLIATYSAPLEANDEYLSRHFEEFRRLAALIDKTIEAEGALKQSVVNIRGLMDLSESPPPTHVLKRGNHETPGIEVQPDVPEVLAPVSFELKTAPGYKTTGRRLAFAKWLVSPENPLTSRVHVNRMWKNHFGRGLVPTLANFGHSGVRPTHAELLDWLAVEFMERGWSQKALHRLILISAAYRQSSATNPTLAERDPDNLLLGRWRPRRVEGEIVRDAMLDVSGQLQPTRFGKPVDVQVESDGSVITADTPEGNRRSIYMIVRRSQHLTMLETFDTPLMEINCPERNESILPLQALMMLNGPFAERCADHLANRLVSNSSTDEERVTLAYLGLFSRNPNSVEREKIGTFLRETMESHLASLGNSATPEQVAAASRAAWRELSLILLNANEFIYID